MNLTGIISISGKPGLFKVVAQGKNNIIVESLEDKKRFPAYSSDRISALEDISVYTYDEDVSLKVILKAIYEKENGAECVSHKADKKELEKYLLSVLPNYDQERVYISDVKKIFQWYNLLHKADALKFEEEEKEEKAPAKAKKVTKKEEGETTEAEAPKAKAKKETKTGAVKAKAVPAAGKEKASVKSAAPKSAAPKPARPSGGKVATVKTGSSRGK